MKGIGFILGLVVMLAIFGLPIMGCIAMLLAIGLGVAAEVAVPWPCFGCGDDRRDRDQGVFH